jgi:THO complex subunit 5
MPKLDPTSLVHDTDLRAVLDTTSRLRAQALQLLELQQRLRYASSSVNGDGLPPTPLSADERERVEREISALQTRLYATNSRLRSQQRRAIMSTRSTKAATTEARTEVDGLSLMLQNLVYEQRHLRGEIDACEGYK